MSRWTLSLGSLVQTHTLIHTCTSCKWFTRGRWVTRDFVTSLLDSPRGHLNNLIFYRLSYCNLWCQWIHCHCPITCFFLLLLLSLSPSHCHTAVKVARANKEKSLSLIQLLPYWLIMINCQVSKWCNQFLPLSLARSLFLTFTVNSRGETHAK